MFRSVKSQIIMATWLIILAILGATAYLVIEQKTKEINQDIYTKAVSFAELTNERVISNYENNYLQSAFAHFDREMAEIYSLNQDITGVSIFNYNGKALYETEMESGLSTEELDRIQAVYPSVKTKGGRIVYLEKSGEDAHYHYLDLNGRTIDPISNTEQIINVVYPFRDQSNITRSYSVVYEVTYDALLQRVRDTAIRIIAIAVAGVLIALLIGYVVAHGITSPIKALTQGATKIGSGDLSIRIPIRSRSEVGMLANTFNKMAADLEESTKAMIEHEKVAKELELAAKIQKELLPKQLPQIANLDIAASLNAATEVGGDCYDFIPVQKNGNLLFYIADVTGHGVGAGLVSAISNALVPSLMNHYDNTKELVSELNKVLTMKTAPNIFVTACIALWETAKGILQFTQAGHDPILHYQAVSGTVIELAHGGLAMGMLPDITAKLTTEKVITQPGDVFVLYTDGIPEAWQSETENFGMERLKTAVQKYATLGTAQQIHDAILTEVRAYMGQYPQADDITLLVVKRTK
ncbi:SpoIIE family protein phosphatase [Candidatus Peregrinibacteria bacterium]|nr:SpoIIE family protein phosphatase [Candidatus Peregrinibacteria bacterium]